MADYHRLLLEYDALEQKYEFLEKKYKEDVKALMLQIQIRDLEIEGLVKGKNDASIQS